MANTPRKMKDPTDAALSAIQDAVNLREGEPDPAAAAPVSILAPASETLPRLGRARPTTDQDLFDEGMPRAGGQPSARRAANDDRRSVGQLLQALQQRPARTSYLVALLFACGWIAVGLFIAAGEYGGDLRALFQSGAPQLFGLASVILVPPIFFFVLAHMITRAQELRIISRSMTEVALRLAEPETLASESIVSVGQAIRREVAAMGDG